MLIFGSIVIVLGLLYASYSYGKNIGTEQAFEFIFEEVLDEQGYTVSYYEDHIEVIPKYQREWYIQRSKKTDF